jgi:hypothetical protein
MLNLGIVYNTLKKYHGYLAWVLLIIALLLLWLLWGKYKSEKSNLSGLNSIITTQNDTITYTKQKNGEISAEKQAAEATSASLTMYLATKTKESEQLKNELISAKIKPSNTSSVTSITTSTGSQTPIIIKVHDTITKGIKQLAFNSNTKYYSVNGTCDTASVHFNEIEFPDSLNIVVGYKRKGIFKAEFDIIATNSNPYSKITGLNNITIQPDKSILSNFWFHFGLGVITGIIIHK